MAIPCGKVEGRVAVVVILLGLNIGPGPQQPIDKGGVALPCSIVKGRAERRARHGKDEHNADGISEQNSHDFRMDSR